jgi:hypothetical protein
MICYDGYMLENIYFIYIDVLSHFIFGGWVVGGFFCMLGFGGSFDGLLEGAASCY